MTTQIINKKRSLIKDKIGGIYYLLLCEKGFIYSRKVTYLSERIVS